MTLGVLGRMVLRYYHPPSYAKCSWRRRGRHLGPGLLNSLFPSPPARCQGLHRCANEYQLSRSEMVELNKQIERQSRQSDTS